MSDSEVEETVAVAEDSAHPVVNTLLASICHGLNVGTPINVKKIVLETFSLSEIKLSHRNLTDLCDGIRDITYHNRRVKDTCVSDIIAWLLELKKIDSFIFCCGL